MEVGVRAEGSLALKEWSSVVEALASGRQALLIRKGGLADRGKVFALEDQEFFLLPSYLHQQAAFVKPDFLPGFQRAVTPPAIGSIAFQHYAIAEEAFAVDSREALLRLDSLHVWNEAFIDHRLEWNPVAPAWVILTRAYRLPEPVIVPEERRFRGCRSWVKLADPLPTAGAEPVLSDNAFAAQARAVRAALAG